MTDETMPNKLKELREVADWAKQSPLSLDRFEIVKLAESALSLLSALEEAEARVKELEEEVETSRALLDQIENLSANATTLLEKKNG